jgi:hypothetical protein
MKDKMSEDYPELQLQEYTWQPRDARQSTIDWSVTDLSLADDIDCAAERKPAGYTH